MDERPLKKVSFAEELEQVQIVQLEYTKEEVVAFHPKLDINYVLALRYASKLVQRTENLFVDVKGRSERGNFQVRCSLAKSISGEQYGVFTVDLSSCGPVFLDTNYVQLGFHCLCVPSMFEDQTLTLGKWFVDPQSAQLELVAMRKCVVGEELIDQELYEFRCNLKLILNSKSGMKVHPINIGKMKAWCCKLEDDAVQVLSMVLMIGNKFLE